MERYFGFFADLIAEFPADVEEQAFYYGNTVELYDQICHGNGEFSQFQQAIALHGGPILDLCCQDMAHLNLPEQYGTVMIGATSIRLLQGPFETFFDHIYDQLKEGGCLCFDMENLPRQGDETMVTGDLVPITMADEEGDLSVILMQRRFDYQRGVAEVNMVRMRPDKERKVLLTATHYRLFGVDAQSAAACLRSYLKGRGVHSIAYTDDTLPSLNDLAEDVLSIADDGLVLVANQENKLLVNALACRIAQLEDLPIYLLYGGSDLNCQAEETVTTIADGAPEETLAELLGAEKGQPLMKCSPYAQQVILPRDAEKFGIWFGRVRRDGSLEYRKAGAVATDVEKIEEAFHGLHQEERKTVPCSGLHFRDKTYLAQVLACFSQNEAPLRYHCPVSGSILEACPDDLDAVAWDVSLEADWNLTKEAAELERLLQAGKLAAVTLDGALLAQAHPIWRQLMTAAEQGQLKLTVHGTIPDTADLAWGSLLRATALRYVPFSKGFVKSRTGVYSGVVLDGYVKHVEVLAEELDETMYETINELASINSSIYWNPTHGADRGTALTFDQAGVATVADPTYEADQAEKLRHNAIRSNLLRMVDDYLCVDDLAYHAPQKIREIPYTEGKRRIAELEGAFGTPQAAFYLFSVDTPEDYACFLADAEQFKETHTFAGLPLACGYLKNYCRFMKSGTCMVDKLPRIQLTGDGNVYLCSNFDHPIGTQKQAIFELTQNCYVQKENQIKERDCNHCVARSWCTKCTQVPAFMADYCDIMRHRTHVIDYIMAGLVYLDMTSSIPVLRNRKPEELKVTSEYMYNLTDPVDTGSELPYFPKFSYLFTDGDAMHVLWSAASGKFFRISPQFALFSEMLFKRLPVAGIVERLQEMLHTKAEENQTIVETIAKVLNESGAMYRPIKR